MAELCICLRWSRHVFLTVLCVWISFVTQLIVMQINHMHLKLIVYNAASNLYLFGLEGRRITCNQMSLFCVNLLLIPQLTNCMKISDIVTLDAKCVTMSQLGIRNWIVVSYPSLRARMMHQEAFLFRFQDIKYLSLSLLVLSKTIPPSKSIRCWNLGPLLLTRIDLNLSIDKWLHPL